MMTATAMFFVYTHRRPNGTPFYVGKGKLARVRKIKRKDNPHHTNIVAKYGAENIIVESLPCSSEEEAHALEVVLIKTYRELGYELVNVTDGGGGISGLKHSAETRAKMSLDKSRPRKPHTQVTKDKQRAAKLGKPNWNSEGKPRPDIKGKPRPDVAERNKAGRSQVTKDKIRATKMGNTWGFAEGGTPWNRGKKIGPRSPEHIAKLSAAAMGNTRGFAKGVTPWNRGKKIGPCSQETIAKRTATRKANRLKKEVSK